MILALPNLVWKSMSMVGIWELRATPSCRSHLQSPIFRDIDPELGSCVLRLRDGSHFQSLSSMILRHGSCVLCLRARATSRVPILVC